MSNRLFLLSFFLLIKAGWLPAQPGSRYFDSLLVAGEYERLIREAEKIAVGNPEIEIIKANAQISLGHFAEARNLLQALTAHLPQNLAPAYHTAQANLALHSGRTDQAIRLLETAWRELQTNNAGGSRQAARTLALLGNAFTAAGNHNEAVRYAEQAQTIRKTSSSLSDEEMAAGYNDLGLVYSKLDPDKALAYYDQAVPLYTALHGPAHPKIAIINTNMGYVYTDLNLYGDAITNFETALQIWQTLYPAGHPNEAFVRLNLGRTYFRLNNFATAKAYVYQALRLFRNAYGEKHPDISSTLNQLGVIAQSETKYDSALIFFQQAIMANSPSFNNPLIAAFPDTREFYHAQVLLFSLLNKSRSLEERHHRKTLALSDLETALRGLFYCDSLIDRIRQQNENEADKLAVSALAKDVYQDGVRMAKTLSEITTRSHRYREHAFYFAEKSKAAVLQEAVADAQAKTFAGIPAALLDTEDELKATLAVATRKLKDKPDPGEEAKLREELFRAQEAYQQFVAQLEQTYPRYFELKFKRSAPSVRDLQKNLDPNTALISYFIEEVDATSSRVYIFSITKNNFRLTHYPVDEPLGRLLIGFGNSLYFQDFALFKKTGRFLNRALRPPLPRRIKELIIIPDSQLGTLPFEALPLPRKSRSFADAAYWNSRYAISYLFSSGLMQKPSEPVAQPGLYLCAPVHFPHLPDLVATEGEVAAISKIFSSKKQIHLFQDASEQSLKQENLENYHYLHLATHGVVDARQPELSRLCLLPAGTEDGNLYSGEIYNLRLNARLVVLSACQTGLGKVSKGEGVIGLSRALAFAGAANIVVSFWSVADESTRDLMTRFYTALQSGRVSFRQALQEAKEKLRENKKYQAPFYWAPFVLVGF